MVKLEFQVDENVINEDRFFNPLSFDAAVLQETFFVLPVRFLVNTTDLFSRVEKMTIWVSSPIDQTIFSEEKEITSIWLPLPVLHFSIVGLKRAKEVYEGKNVTLLLPGTNAYIEFKPCGSIVGVSSSFKNNMEYVSHNELITAFEKFADQVRIFINQDFPELKLHPQIGNWLSGT